MADVTLHCQLYGRLALYDPTGFVIPEHDVLDAYARLAATALDSAVALSVARAEADRSGALLSLGRSLAEVSSIERMAQSLAEATPAVVGSERASACG